MSRMWVEVDGREVEVKWKRDSVGDYELLGHSGPNFALVWVFGNGWRASKTDPTYPTLRAAKAAAEAAVGVRRDG